MPYARPLKGHCTSVVSTAPYCSLATAVPAGHRFRWVGMEHFLAAGPGMGAVSLCMAWRA